MTTRVEDQKYDVIIIGAGIIGVSSAYFLAKSGKKVLVIDQNKVGHGCSYQNAGWMTPCFAMPLPMPGMLLKSFKWLLNPNSPLYIKPSLHPDLISWLARFLLSMTEAKSLAAIEALVSISQRSLTLYKELIPAAPSPTHFSQKGLLMVATSQEGLNDIHTELHLGERFGILGKKLTGSECLATEPLLRPNIIGGVHFLNEASAEPYETVRHLQKISQDIGVEYLEFAKLVHLESKRINSSQCEYSASIEFLSQESKPVTEENPLEESSLRRVKLSSSQVLLTTGSWSKSLGKKWGVNLPVFGGKGYSMHSEDVEFPLSYPIMYLEKKIALTPRQNGFRLAGTLELVDQDFSMTSRRVKNIIHGTKEILRTREPFTTTPPWVGLRPCTPDGLPMMGELSRSPGLYVSLGHQMLGFQSGLGSGEFISQVMNQNNTESIYKIFNPNRFN